MFCQLRSMWIGCHVAPVEPGTIANRVQFWDHCLRFNRCGGALWQVAGIRRLGLISVTGSSGAASGADRLPPPGHGHQALHCDNQTSSVVLNYGACNSVWMLDDFTPDNGATRLVPGTHRLLAQPRDHLAEHPGQILALGRAGTVIVLNGIIWHGGTANRTSRPRRTIDSFWLARQIEQQTDQAHWISPAAIAELSPALRYLVHVLNRPPDRCAV